MNLLKKFSLICTIFFGTLLPLYSFEKIDLSKTCIDNSNCVYKEWRVIDSFQPEFLQLTSLPQNWKKVSVENGRVELAYGSEHPSMTYTFITDFYLKSPIPPTNYGIMLGGVGEVFEVYVNGNLIVKEGTFDGNKVLFHRHASNQLYELPSTFLKEGNNVLLIQLHGYPKDFATGIFRTFNNYIGSYKELDYYKRDRIGYMINFSYLILGVYHLILYLRRNKEKFNLYFALFCIGIFVYYTARLKFFYEIGFDSIVDIKLEYSFAYLLVPPFLFFLDEFFFGKISKYAKYYFQFCIILILITLFSNYYYSNQILKIWQVSALISFMVITYKLINSIRMGNRDAILLIIGAAVYSVTAVYDILDSMFFYQSLVISRYGFFALTMSIGGILVNRFLNLYETVEDLNKNLELKVEKRTEDLKTSLDEIQKLKEKQDGDYFLTTLIVEPLMTNEVKSENIKVEFLVQQKKEFLFKNRLYQIGGDICIADTITLKNREYTVFVNGDAMGKSLQGAGGVIVLGTVFKSIISRTKLSSENQNLYPEHWLKIAFLDLQNIFESFEGSMLISVAMGLIDDQNGMMYFINAEHPATILYRDGVASFIETELALYKIGINAIISNNYISVKTFLLHSYDSVILGSDGRDDILLDPNNPISFNLNSDLILSSIEKAKGNLEKTLEETKKAGTLTDDFSLLKVTYFNPIHNKTFTSYSQEYVERVSIGIRNYLKKEYTIALMDLEHAYQLYPKDWKLAKLIMKINDRLGNREKYAYYYEQYSSFFPWKEELVYKASRNYIGIGDFNSALVLAERLKIRNPHNSKYLSNLIDIYTQQGNFSKAKKYIHIALSIDPENKLILDYQKHIEAIVRNGA